MSLEDLGRYVGRFHEDWDHQKWHLLVKRWAMDFEGGHWKDVWRRAEKGRSVTRHPRHAHRCLFLTNLRRDWTPWRVGSLLDLLIEMIQLRPEDHLVESVRIILGILPALLRKSG